MKYFVDQPYFFDKINEKGNRIQAFIRNKARIILTDDDSLQQVLLDLKNEVKRLNDKYTEFVEIGVFIADTEDEDIHVCVYHLLNDNKKEPIVSLDIHRARGEFSFIKRKEAKHE